MIWIDFNESYASAKMYFMRSYAIKIDFSFEGFKANFCYCKWLNAYENPK